MENTCGIFTLKEDMREIKLVIVYKGKSMWKKNKYRTGLGMADNYRNVKGGSVV